MRMDATNRTLDPRSPTEALVDIYDDYLNSPSIGSNDSIYEEDMQNHTRTPLLNMNGHFGVPPEYYMQSPNGADDQITDDEEEEEEEQVQILRDQAANRRSRYYQDYIQQQEDEGAAKIITQVKDQNTGLMINRTIKKSIKDFKIGRDLGEGSYSTVVLATDTTDNQQYAIKILNKRYIIKEDKVKYVKLEKDALNRLNSHKGIVKLHYTFQDAQNLYFVLDFAQNGELLALIKKFNTMDEDSTKYYSMQLIDALDYMHTNGVIHRDLKPENILIDKDFKIQVTDFGTAKLLDKSEAGSYPQDARAKSFVGTAEYVSPELLNDKYCGKPADIWALGCIIYQMIAGKPPFKAQNEYLTFQKVQKLQYAFTAGFPIIIRDFIKRILLLKPQDRLTIEEIKRHYWFKDNSWSYEELWAKNPPPLAPFKISAKSMKPVPELDHQYPKFQRSKINVRKVSAPTITQHSAVSVSNTASNSRSGSLLPPIQRKGKLEKTNSSPNIKLNLSNSNSGLLSSAPPLPKTASNLGSPVNTTKARTKAASQSPHTNGGPKNASNAAIAALYGNKSTANSSSIANKNNKSLKGANSNVIPGTNIPRPILNTKVSTKNSVNKVTTAGTKKKKPVSQLSVLDLKWVAFMKYAEERVLKAGVIELFKDKTSNIERKYKGCITESPLGYKNKDSYSNPKVISSVDWEAIKFKKEEIDVFEREDDNDSRFKKFFTPKPTPSVTSIEVKYQPRVLVITTCGRGLIFNTSNEMTIEIDLTNTKVKFCEILLSTNTKSGLFAIMTDMDTLLFESDKNEISEWTQCLFKSRLLEKERREESLLINSNDDVMISAAVSKAVSMASPNAGVGNRKSNGAVTPMNSKFLARSRLR